MINVTSNKRWNLEEELSAKPFNPALIPGPNKIFCPVSCVCRGDLSLKPRPPPVLVPSHYLIRSNISNCWFTSWKVFVLFQTVLMLSVWQNVETQRTDVEKERKKDKLTNCLRQPIDSLPVGIGLVPDEGVRQIGLSWKPLLEKATHHRHHQVNLEKKNSAGSLNKSLQMFMS